MTLTRRTALAAAAATFASPAVLRAQAVRELTFYYPIAIGGPVPRIIDGYCEAFQRQTGITVKPVYSGFYGETLTKAVTAIRGGAGPHFSVLLAAELHSLRDMDILVPIEEIDASAETKAWLSGFFPAFMANSLADGKTWSVPFQRSTSIYFYNKAMFREAGLDPEAPPRTWAELVEAGRRLTRREGTNTRWGVQLATNHGTAQWTFGALCNQVDHRLMNEAGTEVYFNHPRAIEAATFWRDLAFAHQITPQGVTEWATLAPNFLQGTAAMIWSTTGNLTNIRANAGFEFGVAGLPGKQAPRTVVGGGNLYLFKHANPAEREASLRFARFLTSPELAADWCIRTGYLAVRPDAWETDALKRYTAEFPAALVAKEQLPVATGELSTYENQRVYKALNDNLQALLTGAKSPQQAMADAQAEADRVLRPFRRG
ncbi:ABC transporter substrate-binding protein [Elioraea sp. Yellowstone]|jgi:sn-glycerol 3-phosphate transport system substrate-binding protein|uniref:ABC transporter substrate-binding protein n=1 Tax=Elioraea sp. Yellowstone TaxID=2592070 RepID=UPI00114E9466|nr:ABC transporter substrate-binding protein [Elioraea sp. Yellowstone]TQF76978.1 ABC transporter substrate-binding protein [Elioraea sp. Yellowstone]